MSENRNLPSWIDGYMRYLDNTESPYIFKRWVAISTIAAVMGRKCKIEWMKHSDTYPNMYIVLVGPAAVGKGVSMGPASSMLKSLGIRTSAQSTTKQALIEDMVNASSKKLNKDGIEVSESSLTVFSEEFSVFLGYQNADLIANLTNWYDCDREWSYKTRSRGEEKIDGVFLNIIGATTPGILQKTLTEDAISVGFTSRVILVYADKKAKLVPIPAIDQDEDGLYEKLVVDLQRIHEMEGYFRPTDQMLSAWIDWYNVEMPKSIFADNPYLVDYGGRRHTHLLKLTMIHSAARSDEMIIRLCDFEAARSALREAESAMPLAFRGYGRNELAQFVELAMEELKTVGAIYIRDFIKKHRSNINMDDLEKIVRILVEMGFCKIEDRGHGKILRYTPRKGQ